MPRPALSHPTPAVERVRRSQQRKRDAGYVRKYLMLAPDAAEKAEALQKRFALSFSGLVSMLIAKAR